MRWMIRDIITNGLQTMIVVGWGYKAKERTLWISTVEEAKTHP